MYFKKLLIANRGEIARRIIRTARALGIETVAVSSDVDAKMPFTSEADAHFVIGAAPPAESYLHQDKILDVARQAGVDAIHPGYGFLAENASFARRVTEAGLTFIGPSAASIGRVGGKLEARRLAVDAGVPVVPGTAALPDLDAAQREAERLGYPVLVKAAAGGGGIGMAVASDPKMLERAVAEAKKRGAAFFGSDVIYLEKLVEAPAHVEVQILADHHGHVMALGERDCTVQRRHQKVVEETPSPRLDPATRRAMMAAAVRLVKAAEYTNAGTVEMIYAGGGDDRGTFYFLEVNSRIQVEHPVTEMVTGRDIVALQLAIAAGERLPDLIDVQRIQGCAIEARVCAENPERKFFPSPGMLTRVVFPEATSDLRIDTGITEESPVPPHYDSLLAKVIAWGPTRDDAIDRLKRALAETVIEGVKTNLSIFPAVLDHPVFRRGEHDTSFLKTHLGYQY
ncbi:MAG: ATP-grasp domain-containing protein [Deltaproteobacteria bacterium]|nr:ATP-grasp domain-containing protein [Deltaproteobacteria bacterium]